METQDHGNTNTYKEDILSWNVETLSKAFKNKELSPLEVTKAYLERISAEDSKYNTFITILAEEAMEQATQAENEIQAGITKGPLHGIPVALKDNIFTKDTPTTVGSAIFKDYISDYNAGVVEKLKDAGAVILGKLNMHEVAYGTTGDRSFAGPVRNPNNTAKITGGSSSGSGAAIAASFAAATLGSDTGGSIRIPASFNGIVGMKPTFGRVSNYGVFPLCRTLDHIGPMTKTVLDNAILLNVLAGYDKRDPYTVDVETEDYTSLIHQGIKGSVVGIPAGSFFKVEDQEVKESYEEAIKIFEKNGAVIKLIDLPDMEENLSAFRTILSCEAYALHEKRLAEYPELWDEEVMARLFTAKDTSAQEYISAQHIKRRAIRDLEEIFTEVDLIVTPTVPILPTDIEQREVIMNGSKVHSSQVFNRFTGPFNLTGHPSLSMPSGTSKTGLPIGIQLTGKHFDEANIYRFAAVLERDIQQP